MTTGGEALGEPSPIYRSYEDFLRRFPEAPALEQAVDGGTAASTAAGSELPCPGRASSTFTPCSSGTSSQLQRGARADGTDE